MALKLKKTAYHDTYFIVNSILGTQKSWRNGYRVLCVKLPACASRRSAGLFAGLHGPPDYMARRTKRSAGLDGPPDWTVRRTLYTVRRTGRSAGLHGPPDTRTARLRNSMEIQMAMSGFRAWKIRNPKRIGPFSDW